MDTSPLDILVCVKRVPMVGGTVVITADGQDVDTRMSGFTVSPHEECAVEEAVRITEREGGTVTVLTLGPPEAADQLRDMLALGAHRGVLLETDGREWGPVATVTAIAAAVRAEGEHVPQLAGGLRRPEREHGHRAAQQFGQPDGLLDRAFLVRADGEARGPDVYFLPVGGQLDLAADRGHPLDADQDVHPGQDLIRSSAGSNSGVAPATATVTGYSSPMYSTISGVPATA